ncbi:hypothetical protein KZZ07_21845 [Mameliella sp. CS4]|uniref:glyoxalase superfamily protein n=1 Tax=Mameliella sp. CS4 TaxID=2862329 RepID=UPI001C5FD100|nr:glyoxalase superfamily protein [Mameliella sp. CS4]MBW4985191.1 hypothetical protein [Mameliella sp. CS4]
MTRKLPTITEAKAEARRLRQKLSDQGTQTGNAQSLELVAQRYGFRDWNALHASIRDLPPEAWVPGQRVRGRYLAQPFEARIVSARPLRPGWFRLALELDEAVDVVRFDSFSNHRKHVQCVVGPSGTSREKTSDGTPHVVLEM